jgi:type I restriction enzyme S subunit
MAARDKAAEWTAQMVVCRCRRLRANDFNLSAGRYRPMSQTQVAHRDPRELLDELAAIEVEIALARIDFSNLTFRAIDERKREAKLIQEGDILLEKSGGGPKQPVGRVCLFRGHAIQHSFGNFIARLRPKSDVLSEFLFYFLWHFHAKGKTSHYQKQTTGIRNLETKRYLTIGVPVPPLPEQRRIVDLLSRAEGIVRLRREAEKKAAELIPVLFNDMFGNPATNPKGWPSDFVARFEGGKNIQAGSENGSLYRILKVSAVTSGVYRESESKPSPDDYSPPASHIVRPGDMLFSRANTEELVGATAIVESTDGQTLLPDKLWRFVWNEPLEPAYMLALFQSAHVRRELGKLSSGTSASMRNISQAKLYELPLPIAPHAIQKAFAEWSAMVASIRSQQTTATARAQAAFDALLARCFAPSETISQGDVA